MISYNWKLNDCISIFLQIGDNFYLISLQFLNKKKQNTRRLYQDSRPPTPFLSVAKDNSKFKSNL